MADQMFDLAGRVAFVTGAGQGIGREIALSLASHGAGGVAVNDFVADRAQAVADEIAASGVPALAVQADVCDLDQVRTAMDKVSAGLGTVGVLVNNAGNYGAQSTDDVQKPFWEVGPEVWNQSIGVNFYGVLNCVSAVIPAMLENHVQGRLVTIISEASRYGDAGLEVYAGAKAGAAGFMRSTARRLGRAGITANCISIAGTVTETTRASMQADPERMKKALSSYVVRRFGEPTDVARAAVFLASEGSSWITGQTYAVNGGFTFSL